MNGFNLRLCVMAGIALAALPSTATADSEYVLDELASWRVAETAADDVAVQMCAGGTTDAHGYLAEFNPLNLPDPSYGVASVHVPEARQAVVPQRAAAALSGSDR